MADEIVEIAPAGDIILIVGKAENATRFKVNSAALRMASKVFEAMLSPKYAEGQALATNSISPCEIKLEDDDAKCLEIILNAIHFRNNKTPSQIHSDDIVSFATLVDKYFLHEALQLAIDQWLDASPSDILHNFLQASIILGHAESFRKTTLSMLLSHTTSYSRAEGVDHDAKFLHVLVKIDKKRDAYRGKFLRALYGIIDSHSPIIPCARTQPMLTRLLASFHKLDLSTESFQKINYLEAHDRVTKIFDTRVTNIFRMGHCSETHAHPDQSTLKEIFIEQNHLAIEGLCLDCEEREYNGETEGPCKYGHVAPA